MEMIQFHPTVVPRGPGLLITEAIVAEGADLVNQKGEKLLETKTLPRDKICLALYSAAQNGGTVLLDAKAIGKQKLASRFPQALELTRTVAGADLSKDPVPVGPAAHRPMGGIQTNSSGETSIGGLFAAGECASNGLNGGGRLAGNTLTEAVVFGRRAGEAAAKYAKGAPQKSFPVSKLSDEEKRLSALSGGNGSGDSLGKIQSELCRLMNEKVGLVREKAGLHDAMQRIETLKERHGKIRVRNPSRIYNYEMTAYLETASMLNLAHAVALAAQLRTESRGAHRRSDFPERDDKNWNCHTVASLVRGTPQIEKQALAGGGS
jgi:succinate dehydrogenase/fumarate reductase flavoprotein subunit